MILKISFTQKISGSEGYLVPPWSDQSIDGHFCGDNLRYQGKVGEISLFFVFQALYEGLIWKVLFRWFLNTIFQLQDWTLQWDICNIPLHFDICCFLLVGVPIKRPTLLRILVLKIMKGACTLPAMLQITANELNYQNVSHLSDLLVLPVTSNYL